MGQFKNDNVMGLKGVILQGEPVSISFVCPAVCPLLIRCSFTNTTANDCFGVYGKWRSESSPPCCEVWPSGQYQLVDIKFVCFVDRLVGVMWKAITRHF